MSQHGLMNSLSSQEFATLFLPQLAPSSTLACQKELCIMPDLNDGQLQDVFCDTHTSLSTVAGQ